MSVAEYFVRNRLLSWTLFVITMIWGVYAYLAMPQRQDPVIPIRNASVVTVYPGASALEVEEQVSRKIEKKLTENPSVEKVSSINRNGLSVVFVDLSTSCKNAELVWQDLDSKLATIQDLPEVGGKPLKPILDKDFGDTVSVMLTISSPLISDDEINQRAAKIADGLKAIRIQQNPKSKQISIVVVHPSNYSAEIIERLGNSLVSWLHDKKMIQSHQLVGDVGALCLNLELVSDVEQPQLEAVVQQWENEKLSIGLGHPDIWPVVIVEDLEQLARTLREACHREPGGVARYSYSELRKFANVVHDRVRQSKLVGKIEQIGIVPETIYLYYSDTRLNVYGLDVRTLAKQIDERNSNFPTGKVELNNQELSLKSDSDLSTLQEIANISLRTNDGLELNLRDLVEPVRGYQDPPSMLNFRSIKGNAIDSSDGHAVHPVNDVGSPLKTSRAITLAIRQVKGTQIGDFDKDITRLMDSARPLLPEDLRIERTSNEPHEVKLKIEQFDHCLVEAIVIVVAVCLLFMEWRSALVVAISIPVTVAMTLGFCHLLGIDLQQISVAALIIALGLLVDDPVVAADAINRELAAGQPPERAAWLGPDKLSKAILFATITNCVAFLPLLLVEGDVGEFIYSLPVVVTASLVASRIVSMTFVPLLGFYLLKGQAGLENDSQEGSKGSRFARVYNGISEWCLEYRWTSMAACLIVLAGGLSVFPWIQTSFFPKDLQPVFTVNLFLADGTPINETKREAIQALSRIDELVGDDVKSYTTFVGAGGPRFWLSITPEQPASHYAQVIVHTKDARKTAELAAKLKSKLPSLLTASRVTVEQLESGPPIGVPVQVRVYGDDIVQLRKISMHIQKTMQEVEGTDNVHDDWGTPSLQVKLKIDSSRARQVGLTNQDVALATQSALSGYTATQKREQEHLIPVVLRLRPDERGRMEDILNLTVSGTEHNRGVSINQVAELEPELESPVIRRRLNERCIIVKCDAVPGVLPSNIVQALEPKLAEMASDWPVGIRYEFGGEKEEQEKGFFSMYLAMAVSITAIYVVMIAQFKSLTKPMVVFGAVPFGMLGGLMGLLIFNVSLGFFALLGLASLAGIIISHVIILFEYIEESSNTTVRRAVIDAALVRLRPVLVTVLATVGGLIPLAYKGGPLWEPLCYVQIIGLLVATVVTKVVVPVMYVIFVEDLKLIQWENHHAEAS